MKYYSVFLFAFLLSTVSLNGQIEDRERLYIQTDKQLYMAGELLWMKLYTTDSDGELQSLSKIGYVELVSDSISEIQVKIDFFDGMGEGWMELSPMLSTGYYRLMGYTRYMRNEGPSVFFEKIIAVVNPFQKNNRLLENKEGVSFPEKKVLKESGNGSVQLFLNQAFYGKRNLGELQIKGLPKENISLAISIAGVDPIFETPESIADWESKQLTKGGNPSFNKKYLPEYEGAIVEGQLIDHETEQPEGNRKIIPFLSFPGKEIQLYQGKNDEETGRIEFYTCHIAGKKELVTTVVADEQKYRIDIISPFVEHPIKEQPVLTMDSTWRDYLEKRNLSLQVLEAYTADSLRRIKPPLLYYYKPDHEYILDEYTRFNFMEEIFVEFIQQARIRREGKGYVFHVLPENSNVFSANNNVLVLLDNIPIFDHEVIINYNPLLVKNINIHRGNYRFGGQIYSGIISFWTYKNDYPSINFGEETQIFDFDGTQPYRYFYVPTYNEGIKSRVPDFRHTLLWNPSIETEGKNELVIPFHTSDLPGNYRVTVEGINKNGTIVSATTFFEVIK